MQQITTEAIVLSRSDYDEAAKIVHFITPLHGKVGVIAKGVRKAKSKLAGGIELFTISDISYVLGRSELKILTSSRLKENFGNIVKALERSELGFEFLKTLNKATDDQPGEDYYQLLASALRALNNLQLETIKAELWFYTHLLWLEGRAPNLSSDNQGNALKPDRFYLFDFENMAFLPSEQGIYSANHIKLMRISIGKNPELLQKVVTGPAVIKETVQLLKTIYKYHQV